MDVHVGLLHHLPDENVEICWVGGVSWMLLVVEISPVFWRSPSLTSCVKRKYSVQNQISPPSLFHGCFHTPRQQVHCEGLQLAPGWGSCMGFHNDLMETVESHTICTSSSMTIQSSTTIWARTKAQQGDPALRLVCSSTYGMEPTFQVPQVSVASLHKIAAIFFLIEKNTVVTGLCLHWIMVYDYNWAFFSHNSHSY